MKSVLILLLVMIYITHSTKTDKATKSIDNNFVLPKIEATTVKIESATDCPCLGSYPPCCTPEFNSFQCGCAPKPACSGCSDENMIMNVHDSMLKLAMKDALNQQAFAQKAKMQMDLFQKAQEYAKEAGIQEMKAKQFANSLNETTKKAQYARSLMFQTAAQVRSIAEQTLRVMTPMKCVGVSCGVQMNPETTITTFPSMESQLGSTSIMFSSENNLRGYP